MMITIKRSCAGCRALRGTCCELGYRNRANVTQPWKDPVPLEACPKPRTYAEYFSERRKQQEQAGIDTLRNESQSTPTKTAPNRHRWRG